MNNPAAMLDNPVNQNAMIRLGRHFDRTEAIYDLNIASNLGIGVVGMSGSGKTHTLKRLIHAYASMGTTIVILDVHGDYDNIPGLPDKMVRDTIYGYTGNTGRINPLHVEAKATGGLYLAIKQFGEVVKLFHRSLGQLQRSTLIRVAKGVYHRFGFRYQDPSTWSNPPPTLEDMLTYIADIFEGNALNEAVEDETDDAIASELSHAWDEKRLGRVRELISGMVDSGLFGDDSLRLRMGSVNRFLLKGLSDSDMQALIHLIMSRLFNVAFRTFPHDEPKIPRMMVVLDEGKVVKSISQTEMSPINRIATETRKFGMGMMLGVQSGDHLTDDVRRNCGLTIVLPVHPSDIGNTARQFNINKDDLKNLRPQADGLVYMKSGRFVPTHMFAP